MQKLLAFCSAKSGHIFAYNTYENTFCHELTTTLVFNDQGPVVQGMVSIASSLRGQLVKCFTTLIPNTLIFFVEKMREAFARKTFSHFFNRKILAYFRYQHLKF